jgi:hypothetical protein
VKPIYLFIYYVAAIVILDCSIGGCCIGIKRDIL